MHSLFCRAGASFLFCDAGALLRNGYGQDDPVVAKALTYLEKSVQKNGGIYDKQLANYTTCVALLAFKEANKDGRCDTIIKNATAFLKSLQDETADAKDVRFGGVGFRRAIASRSCAAIAPSLPRSCGLRGGLGCALRR